MYLPAEPIRSPSVPQSNLSRLGCVEFIQCISFINTVIKSKGTCNLSKCTVNDNDCKLCFFCGSTGLAKINHLSADYTKLDNEYL